MYDGRIKIRKTIFFSLEFAWKCLIFSQKNFGARCLIGDYHRLITCRLRNDVF